MILLVADAHTAGDKSGWGAPPTEQVVAHTNLHWNNQSAAALVAAVTPTEDVDSPARQDSGFAAVLVVN